jgi:hypothetical protein
MLHAAHNGLHERALTTAIRAYDTEEVVSIYVEVDVFQRYNIVVAHTELSDFD